MNIQEAGVLQEFRSYIIILLGIEHACVHEARKFLNIFELMRLRRVEYINVFYILG